MISFVRLTEFVKYSILKISSWDVVLVINLPIYTLFRTRVGEGDIMKDVLLALLRKLLHKREKTVTVNVTILSSIININCKD